MLKLTKLSKRDPVYGKNIRWLHDRRLAYRRARVDGTTATRYLNDYRDPRVKTAVDKETSGKCAYCESKPKSTAPGDVEHILPKDADPERLLDYDNLTFVCSWCNITKSNKEYLDGYGLLNPYADDPTDFLYALGPMLLPKRNDPAKLFRGTRTINEIGLDRASLLERRAERLKDQWDLLLRDYLDAEDQTLKKVAAHLINAAVAPDAEFSVIAHAFFAMHAPDALR